MASDSDSTGGPQRERGDAHRGAGIRARFARHIREQARGTIGDLRLVNSDVPETNTVIFTSRVIGLSDPAAAQGAAGRSDRSRRRHSHVRAGHLVL